MDMALKILCADSWKAVIGRFVLYIASSQVLYHQAVGRLLTDIVRSWKYWNQY